MLSGLGHSNFSGASNDLDGAAYGIVSAGTYNPTTGLSNQDPFAKHEVDFFFKNVASFQFLPLQSGVVFQYGTNLGEKNYGGTPNGPNPQTPGVPEPSTLAIAGLGGLGLLVYRLRRRRTA